jgi:rod shape-determining protein MreD
VIALLLASVRVRPGVAALIGFAMGIVADSLSLGAFGSAALAMTVVGFTAAWLKAAFFADNLWLNAFFFFLGKWAFDIVFLLSSERVQGAQLAIEMFLWSPLSAGVTALAGVLMLMILRPLLEPRTT